MKFNLFFVRYNTNLYHYKINLRGLFYVNGTNELLRSILKIDEEERARTQATEEYREKAYADRSQMEKKLTEEAMECMHQNVEKFAEEENKRAQEKTAALQQKKQEIVQKLERMRQEKMKSWVDNITARVLGRGE